MSDPKNNPNYFSKLKDGIKNFEYQNHMNQAKEKLSTLQNKAVSSEYYQKVKDFKDKVQTNLQNERKNSNDHKKSTSEKPQNQKNSGTQSNQLIFKKMWTKAQDLTNHIKTSAVEGKLKDDFVDLAKNVKNYEYSKKFQELSEKTQHKIKEADIPEKIKIIKEKANETAKDYQVKEKISNFSEKSKDKAKIFAEKSKENLNKTNTFFQNQLANIGGKFKNFSRQKANRLFGGVILVVFVYGFATSLPKAYYDYKRYVDERELRKATIQEISQLKEKETKK